MAEHPFPAGYETDGSDEWDIGPLNTVDTKGTYTVVPVAEDVMSTMKRAINTSNIQLVQQLLESGVDVETRLGCDWTALMCAAHAAHYDMAELLLNKGANANYSKNQYTVLMAAITAAASENNIVKCVELILSRNADPNIVNGGHMTPLMLAAREDYSQVINLLVSYGAEVNAQDFHGYTALAVAVQYDRERAVLKLLQLGGSKTIRTNAGKSPADLATVFNRSRITSILAGQTCQRDCPGVMVSSKEETMIKFFKRGTDPPASRESLAKLCDIELLLHGLDLEHLAGIMMENDITWSCLVNMEKDDLQKIGISDPEDQRKVLSAVQEMVWSRVDLDSLSQLEDMDRWSEELYNFLISLRQQCCYLIETVQDVTNSLPRRTSELVLSLDPKKEAQAVCNELLGQLRDLQKEVACLHNLLNKKDEAGDSGRPPPGSHGNWMDEAGDSGRPPPGSRGNWKRGALKRLALSMLGAGLLFLLSRAKNVKIVGF